MDQVLVGNPLALTYLQVVVPFNLEDVPIVVANPNPMVVNNPNPQLLVGGGQGPPGPASKWGIEVSLTGTFSSGEILGMHTADGDETFDMAASFFTVPDSNKPTGNVSIIIRLDNQFTGTIWGTIDWLAGENDGTPSATDPTLADKHTLYYIAPAPRDVTFGFVSGTWVGQ